MAFNIHGIGTATPSHTLDHEGAIELASRVCCETPKQARLMRALVERSGVDERGTCVPYQHAFNWEATAQGPTTAERMMLYEQHSGPLAVTSASNALANAQCATRDVTHLVTVSCTGFSAPGVDLQLIEQLGLPPTTERVHVGFMGCHAAINGLRVAQGLAASSPAAVVLLVATELCSLHYAYEWNPERLVGNAIFADGSAAIVGSAQPRNEPTPTQTECRWTLQATGSCVLPNSSDMMSWMVRDHGFEMTLSASLPQLIEKELRPWLTAWLDRQGLGIEQVGSWAIHPGGPKIVSAAETALGLDSKATALSREVLRNHGNMSSAMVLFVIEAMRNSHAPGPCVALGFGPGIVAEVALFV